MRDATGYGAAVKSGDRDDIYRTVVADLAGLLERIHASLELVDRAIVVEAAAGKEDVGSDIIVLDDVTPSYAKAAAALQACGASLGLALHMLQEPMTMGGTAVVVAEDGRDARPAIRA